MTEKKFNTFWHNNPYPLFFAEDATKLIDEFKKITMSVTLRTESINKNQIIEINNILDGKDINEMTFDDFKV